MAKKIFLVLTAVILFSLGLFLIDQNSNPTHESSVTKVSKRDNPQKRIEWEFKLLRDPATNKIPENIRTKELQFAKSIERADVLRKSSPGNSENILDVAAWQSNGPINIGGRTRALAYDISDPTSNTILAGGVSGGMWRTTDGGANWSRVTLLTQLASVTTVAQDRKNGKTNVWYYGTGERIGNSASGMNDDLYLGDGIFKSTDGGVSWNQLPSTVNGSAVNAGTFSFVWRLGVDNSNTAQDEIYAAVGGGIMRSLDGGNTWANVLNGGANGLSTDIAVTSTGVVYATISSGASSPGIWRSATGNEGDWTNISPAGWPTNFNRTVLAFAPSNENILYFLSETPGAGTAGNSLWKYTYLSGNGSGAGGSWENRSASIPDGSTSINALSLQGSYNMAIAVKTDDPNVVFIGGVDLIRSTNGFADNTTNVRIGGTGSGPLGDYPGHFPDQHALVFHPTNPNVMLSANDGGVFRTDNNLVADLSWTGLNNRYVSTQYYGIAIDYASNSKIVTGGMQDRGNFFVNPDISNEGIPMDEGGLDGTLHAVANNRSAYYFGAQEGALFRANFADNGAKSNFAEINPQIQGLLFVNPYTMDPSNSEIIYYAGGQNILRTNSASTENGNTWTTLNNTQVSTTITAIGVSHNNNPSVVYYGTQDGQIFRLDNANTGDPNKVDIWTGKGFPNGYVNNIAVDRTNSNRALAVFSNYNIISLFYTSDAGNTWTAVSGNLEENPDGSGNGPSTRWASIMNYNGQTYYLVATSTGVYSTTNLDGMNTQWALEAGSVIGNVVCMMVLSRDSDGFIAVGTHGNGLFTAATGVTGVDDSFGDVPAGFNLAQNYPNPFNPSTTISFSLPEAGNVSMQIYNSNGELVRTLISNQMSEGTHQVEWDSRNSNGLRLSSGVYFYRLTAGTYSETRKMMLLK